MSRFHNRNFELLEPYEGKLSCTVLRGERGSNDPDLPDKAFYDGLKSVHDLVKDAQKVQKSVLLVGEISEIYVTGFQRIMNDENFSESEVTAIGNGYSILLNEGSDLLGEVKGIITQNGLSMSDSERMEIIDRIYERLKRHRDLVSYYTRKNISVSYIRAMKTGDTRRVLALYGNTDQKYGSEILVSHGI